MGAVVHASHNAVGPRGASLAMLSATLFLAGSVVGQMPMAEAPPLSNEELAARADVVVHGVVESIVIERVLSNLFDDRSYLATFRIDRVERGEDLEDGSRIEVRYWRRDALDDSVLTSVAGFTSLPSVGETAWLFANRDEADGTLVPVMPNGWRPDEERPPDPTGLYGGVERVVRDQRTGSMTPLAFGLLAIAAGIGAGALRAGPQTRPAVLLLAAGVAISGVILLVW